MSVAEAKLTKKDFVPDNDVRWCPGCGDYSILNALQKLLPDLNIPKENFVIVSGIGCSSRFPYYMDTYGFHTIHGRAPTIATGVKVTNPDLSVWMITGDGDGLSIGGNHFMHILRRNVNVNILLFNNQIYGLTKGQYSPTSEQGKKTKTSPMGSVEYPINPVSLALAAEGTFVARTTAANPKHMYEIFKAAHEHKGTSIIEIYQNCNIFNDGTFDGFTGRDSRDDNSITMEHGKPLIFGKEKNKGIRFKDMAAEIVTIGENGITEEDIAIHNTKESSAGLTYALSRMTYPENPVPLGIFKANDSKLVFEDMLQEQIHTATETKGEGDLQSLFLGNDFWEVKEEEEVHITKKSTKEFVTSEEQMIMSENEQLENVLAENPFLGALAKPLGDLFNELEAKDTISISSEESLQNAIQLILENHIGCLPVMEDNKVVGILSERDITLKIGLKNIDLEFTPVSSIMTKNPHVLNTDNTIGDAFNVMSSGAFRHLPILDHKGDLKIASVKTLIRYLCKVSQ